MPGRDWTQRHSILKCGTYRALARDCKGQPARPVCIHSCPLSTHYYSATTTEQDMGNTRWMDTMPWEPAARCSACAGGQPCCKTPGTMPHLQECVSGELAVIWGNHVSCDWVDGAAARGQWATYVLKRRATPISSRSLWDQLATAEDGIVCVIRAQQAGCGKRSHAGQVEYRRTRRGAGVCCGLLGWDMFSRNGSRR